MEELLNEYGKRVRFKRHMAEVVENSAEPTRTQDWKVWKRWGWNALAAASIAFIAAFCTLWFSGYYKNMEQNSSNYRELRRDMNTVKRDVSKQHLALQDMSSVGLLGAHAHGTATNFGATGFLLSPDGYVVTNHHVVTGADSVHLQNSKGESFQAQVIYMDPATDLAILHITDSAYRGQRSIPYSFKEQEAELGEDVFTLGFPRDEAVYGQGYLSSMSGYSGDTSAYQISIPLNPGNSGGPLLDSRGQVIGIVSGKQAGFDGTSFAIKTKVLTETIRRIPEDVLEKPLVLSQKRHPLSGLSRPEQLKRIQDYVYIVKVF